MEPSDSHPLSHDLSAFADGELDPAATRRLLQQLLDDPAAVERLRRVQQLTAAARRAVRSHTPPVPDALRDRLRALADPPPADAAPRRWAWFARAAAAVVLLAGGLWIGRSTKPPATPRPDVVAADVLPAGVVARAEEIHGFCSRLAAGLHAGGYPADVAALAGSVQADLHSDHPYPDLTPIGYRYRGAGPCGNPLVDTAHLLYRSVRAGSVNAVSVFVQPWRGQYPLAAGRLYTVSVAQSPFPMLAWRTEHVVYFLLADDAATERAAVALVRGGPSTRR